MAIFSASVPSSLDEMRLQYGPHLHRGAAGMGYFIRCRGIMLK